MRFDVVKLFNKLRKSKYPLEEVREKEKEYKKWLENHSLPIPSEQQLEWLDSEIGMFCHFGINTFHNKEWSDGTLPASSFNPKNLDCNQWVKVARDLGANYIIITAKHHDGFCLWPTETTDYSVKRSPWKDGKGDVIKEFVAACRKDNMKFGFYLSPWDRNQERYGCYKDEKAYDNLYSTQLTELLSIYAEPDEVFEIWFDGAGSAGHTYNWEKIMGVCKKYQPHALIFNMGAPTIRWVGNEDGLAGEANWNVMQVGEDMKNLETETFDNVGMKLKECYGLGNMWMPAECDTVLRRSPAGRNHWFYHTDDEKSVLPMKRLIEIYEKSVGRGANLLLNLSPDREGLIPKSDAIQGKRFGDLIRSRYSSPIAKTDGIGNMIELSIPENISFNCIMTQEDITQGQRVREYEISAFIKGKWKNIASGYSIGHKKLDNIKMVEASKIRLTITNSLMEPQIKTFGVYKI